MKSQICLALFFLTTTAFSKLTDNSTTKNTLSNFNDTPKEDKSSSEEEFENLKKQLKEIEQVLKQLTNDDDKRNPYPKNCKEAQERGNNATGVYTIYPEFAVHPFLVICDMESRGGGWVYILNRFVGLQDFDLSWDDYKIGFGNLAGEFWLGLEHLHELTAYDVNELLIELEDWDDKEVYAHYGYFAVGSASEEYRLKLLGGYSGNSEDSFSSHGGMKFTTKDNDNDRYKLGNCAKYRSGGWWYNNCASSLLTGKYLKGTSSNTDAFSVMFWETFRGSRYSLKAARMMVRPRSYVP